MEDNNGNWGENFTFRVTKGSGFQLSSDTGCAPARVVQPFHQQQVQNVPPKPSLCPAFPVSISQALNQQTENGWHKDEGWMQAIWTQHWVYSEHSDVGHRLPCRSSGQGNEEIQNRNKCTWLRVQLRCQSYHRSFLTQMCQLDCLGSFALLARCSQQFWGFPTSLVGQPLVFHGHWKWRCFKIQIYFPDQWWSSVK